MRVFPIVLILLALTACTQKKKVPVASAELAFKAEKSNRMLLEAAADRGYVRILVTLKVSFEINTVNAENVAEVQKEIRNVQNEFLKNHFVNADNPKEGFGYTRDLKKYDITPKLAVNVNIAELEKIAADPAVTEINPDGIVRAP